MSADHGNVALWSTGRRTVFLRPGEYVVAPEPTHVITVLGSCVAVVVYSPRLRAGAMCHAVLPEVLSAEDDTGHPRFVAGAVDRLFWGLGRLGASSDELVVKAFGGAENLATACEKRPGVGVRNIEALKTVLALRRIALAAADLGGREGRKLHFLSDTGAVYLKRLGGRRPPRANPEER